MVAVPERVVDTGPIELRSYAASGRRLGTVEDCYDGSPWELHRGELIEQVRGKDIHGALMALIAALFRTHARGGMTVMTDVYCDLSDPKGPSLRAPDVVLVGDLPRPKDAPYHGRPILAVEVRGTQSKRYLAEKVELYLEHDWPCVWIAHANREELEVVRPGSASVTYRAGLHVPLEPELDKYGLSTVPVAALFDQATAAPFLDEWASARGEARGRVEAAQGAVRAVLDARRLPLDAEADARLVACDDPPTLARWLQQSITATTAAEALR